MGKEIIVNGRRYTEIGRRSYSVAPATPTFLPLPPVVAKQRVTLRQFDRMVENTLATTNAALEAAKLPTRVTQAQVETGLLERFEIKPASSISVPLNRTNAVGGICPKFGDADHWQGASRSPDADVRAGKCGKNKDGHFASAKGFAYHQSITL